ncbi:MAG: serine hydrolase domain-containing protein [Pseudomonadota bacterium]
MTTSKPRLGRRPFLIGSAAGLIGSAAGLASFAAFPTFANERQNFANDRQDFLGEWGGVLDVGATKLRLKLVIGPDTATLYSLDQGNAEIPADQIEISGADITLTFPSISARFDGTRSGTDGQVIEGTFTQGRAFPLVLTKGEIPAAREFAPLTEERLKALRAEIGAPALIAAARGTRALTLVDGVRALGRDEQATPSDQWHIGSITKSMTATLVARLVEQGVITWSTTVGDVLGKAVPDINNAYTDCNFLHLLSHRAGLQANIPQMSFALFPFQEDDARASRLRWSTIALAQEPAGPKEDTFLYANNGYVIAGTMLEVLTGERWEDLMVREVFQPLGMTGAGFGPPGSEGAFDQPVGHRTGFDGKMNAHPPGTSIADNPTAIGPAGIVHARADDMLAYLNAHRERTDYLSQASWKTLHTPPFGGDYACGWVIRPDGLWHNGTNTFWYAEALFSQETGSEAFAAANDGRLASVAPGVGAALKEVSLAVQ